MIDSVNKDDVINSPDISYDTSRLALVSGQGENTRCENVWDEKLTVGSLFAGIGGIDLGLERTGGFETRWQVEINEYCRRVLAKHWPNVKRYGDIRTVTDVERVDVLCGGFPCQDISFAGTGKGLAGERSGLWFEYLRLIRLVRPRWVLVENSAALINRGLSIVLAGLAAAGFDAEWSVLRASDFGAPHERERVYILAYSHRSDGKAGMGTEQNGPWPIFTEDHYGSLPIWLQAPGKPSGVGDGLPAGIYRPRVTAVGNAVVPQIIEWIGNQILAFERSSVVSS